jgi:hypothetical protein
LLLLNNQRGSISILIIGIFSILLITSLILIDISSIYLDKRVLSHATEAAVQRGVRNLDLSTYYEGEYNALSAATSLLGDGEEDPGIPINCESGEVDVQEVIRSWENRNQLFNRSHLATINIESFECDGYSINIETTAVVQLPVSIPFLNQREITIRSFAGAMPERTNYSSFLGFDLS